MWRKLEFLTLVCAIAIPGYYGVTRRHDSRVTREQYLSRDLRVPHRRSPSRRLPGHQDALGRQSPFAQANAPVEPQSVSVAHVRRQTFAWPDRRIPNTAPIAPRRRVACLADSYAALNAANAEY